MADEALPTFDLVVSTVGRSAELRRLLDSLEAQTYRRFRLLVVDQNDDDRVERILSGAAGGMEIVRLRSARGLSRARNVALDRLVADVVAFPDDDCAYPPDLLERVAYRLAASPWLDGLTGKAADAAGRSSPSWAPDPTLLAFDSTWNRVISYAIFLRRETVVRIGRFDEQLGLGGPGPWSSGEEIDFVLRAVLAGAQIAYDPELIVAHELRSFSSLELRAIGARDGASVGYILRKHRFPTRTLARMFTHPIGGVAMALARGDRTGAGFHIATLRGRVRGYRGGRGVAGSGHETGEHLGMPIEPGS
jgi:glycosyltransferase involved in cell wall biosynthesis